MEQTAGKILKSNQVNIEGKYKLELSQTNHRSHDSLNNTLKSPQVKIIENNEGYVVIQVICSCGEQINLKGNYITQNKS